MDVLDKIEMDGFESSHNNFSMVWKSYQVLRECLEVSNDEIDELIKYHTSKEEFEICDKLNKFKTMI
jgi:hypothetical protein